MADNMRCTITDRYGVVVLRDAQEGSPPSLADDAPAALEHLARQGRIFFIDREDPIKALDIEVGTSSATDLDRFGRVRPLGSYLLEIPSGQLVVSSAEAWVDAQPPKDVLPVTPGSHTVSAYCWEFDAAKYQDAIEQLVGGAEERFHSRVDKLYFLGCLPLVAAIVAMIAAAWWWGIGLAAAAIVLWLPYFAFKNTKRYQAVEAATRAYEKQLPHYVLQLTKVASNEGLTGGYVR